MRFFRATMVNGDRCELVSDDTFTLSLRVKAHRPGRRGDCDETTPRALAAYFSRRTLLALARSIRADENDRAKLALALAQAK